MLAYSLELAAVAALLLASLAVRATARNRHVRRRQRLTILLAAAWILSEAVLAWAAYPPDISSQVRNVAHVALALAIINFLVVVVANPLRSDQAPEHFPVILQDTVIVALFAVAATAILRERVLALSAVGAVVIGFALQDTLGNAFAGLAIQTEKPFDVGHWIRVAGQDGQVMEITWRATKLRTKDNSFLIVPNNVMSREVVLNFSEPVLPTRLSVEVGAAYEQPPSRVKAAILEAIGNAPLALRDPAPDVLVVDFGASAITYRAWFWVDDFAADERARDQVRSGVRYTFRRYGIEIPFPIQVQYDRVEPPARHPETTERVAGLLGSVAVFAPLTGRDRLELAESASEQLYTAGEVVVRQGVAGTSMFIIGSGEVEVVIEPAGARVATIGAGGFFGEMSLLEGAERTATVRATTDSVLVEVGVEAFRRFVTGRPAVLEAMTQAAVERRVGLERTRRDAAAAADTAENVRSLLARVRQFLGLG